MKTMLSTPGRRAWLGLTAVLLVGLAWSAARAVVLVEDGTDAPGSGAGLEMLAVSSSHSTIGSDARALTVELMPGDHAAFSRAADFQPEPSAVLCRFNVAVSQVGVARPAVQVFRIGWDFGPSNADEVDGRTYGSLGLVASADQGFLLRDRVRDRTSRSFHGTQAVSWALNNSGRALSYSAPNGSIETIANDRMDIWVGHERVFDDILATTPNGRITDFKWFWGQGSGVTRFEHFEIRSLEEATSAPQMATPSDQAANAEARP